MLSVVHIRPDGTEGETETGSTAAIVGHVAGFDWQVNGNDSADMPRLDIRRDDNGDLLTIEYDASSDLFQCSVIMTVPKKILGVSSYLWDGQWESDAILIDRPSMMSVVEAFCDKDVERLRGVWDLAEET